MKPHPIDPFSLVIGLSLVALGIAGFAGGVDLAGIERSAFVPIALLAIAAAIASTLWRSADRSSTRGDESDRSEQTGI
jgi:hypothetical protein